MKTKTATAVKLSVVNEPSNIDQIFTRNALGYLASNKAGALSVEDSVGYVVSKLESGQSAIRDAILLCGYIFKTRTADVSKKFEESLKSRWSGSTLPNMISISKSLPLFESKGLSIANVRDLYGLRECSKLLKGDESSKQAIALLNKGESPRNVKEKLSPKAEREEREESPVESESLADKEGIASTLVLTYVERFAILADSEARLKLARQIISKLALGNYILATTDAHKAIQELKAKK